MDKIKEYFFVNPRSKLRVREIERELKMPLPSVIRYCKELEEERLLSLVEIGKVRLYTASRSSKFLLEKKLFNIKCVYDSDLISYLKKELSNPVVILFGSYSRGEDVEDSDIDIYVETSSEKVLSLSKFSKFLRRQIQIHQYKNLKKINNHHLANNIINGVVLNNYVEVFDERKKLG